MVFSLAAVRLLGQVCVLSPDMQGGSQYNQPQPLVANYLGQNVPVAWPRSAEVYYVEFEGTYNGYSMSIRSGYRQASRPRRPLPQRQRRALRLCRRGRCSSIRFSRRRRRTPQRRTRNELKAATLGGKAGNR